MNSPQTASARVHRVTQIEISDPRWDRFVASHPDRSIFHHPGWSQALMEEYGRKPFALACEDDDGTILGILPLLEVGGVPFKLGAHVIGRRLSSLPRTPVVGPLSATPEVTKALVRAAIAKAREAGMTLELKTQSGALESAEDGLAGVVWKQSLLIPLLQGGAELRVGNARKAHRVKWAVNKALKLGVKVRWAETEEELHVWYRLYLDTMRWHTAPPRPYRFFESLWRRLHPSGLMRLLLAYREQDGATDVLSGCIYLASGRSFYCWQNGRRREQLRFHPNDAIHWEGITTARTEGFEFYDFGQVEEDQQGLIEFKSKWGAEQRRSWRYYYPAPKSPRPPAPKPDAYAHRIVKHLWRHVPLALTMRIGDWIYGYL